MDNRKYISTEIERVNSMEAMLGNIMFIDDKFVMQFANLVIMKDGNDAFLNYDGMAYLNFCFVVFEGVETVTFDYEHSRLIDPKFRHCYGGEHYLTDNNSEFWISYKSGKILLMEDSEFIYYPKFMTKQEKIDLLIQNPITNSVLKDLGVLRS